MNRKAHANLHSKSFGYNEYQSLLLSLPGCAVAFVSVWLGTYWAGKYNARGIAIIALVIPTLIGGALMAFLPAGNKAGLLAGNFLTYTVGSSESSYIKDVGDRLTLFL